MTPLFWIRWAVRVAVAFVVVCVLVFVGTCAAVWWVAREDARPRSDAILVLGASQFNGRPSEVFAARLAHARDLYRERVAPYVVTVGGKQPGDAFTEAQAGATWLHGQGVPSTALVAVPTGSDTLGSLRAVDSEMQRRGWHTVVLVTDPWHELRSRRMASDLGISPAVSPTRTGPAVHSRTTELRYIAREAAGYIYYRLFHSDATKGPGAV